MLGEVQKLKDSLKLEKETEVAELRRALASEQASEEAELQAKKAASLDELKSRLEEEQEEEEAKLMEEKQDTLRALKQQVCDLIGLSKLMGAKGTLPVQGYEPTHQQHLWWTILPVLGRLNQYNYSTMITLAISMLHVWK